MVLWHWNWHSLRAERSCEIEGARWRSDKAVGGVEKGSEWRSR
jgi:hypothetical protein